MDDTDRYLFDLNGYLVVPDALDRDLLARLNGLIEQRCAALRPTRPEPCLSFNDLLDLGPATRALIDQPTVAAYLGEWLGEGYRLDHDYAMVIIPGAPANAGAAHIHGGGNPYHPSRGYSCQGGRIQSCETAVSFALTDVAPGEGGMGVIPGSHKANLPLPWADRPGPYSEEVVRQEPVRAGSAVIFTESLSHCTLPWRGAGERRTLFYKYAPRNIQISGRDYDASRWPDLSERQKALLEPACTRRK